MDSFTDIYNRILFVSNCETQMELASVLEISQSSISDAKRRQSIPSDWLVKLYDKFGVSLDWLRFKKEPIYTRSLPELGKMKNNSLQEDTDSLGFIAPVFDTKCTFQNDKLYFTTVEETILPRSLQERSDLVFAYNGNGMDPVLSKGCLVGVCTKKDSDGHTPLISGEVYALYTSAEGIIFRHLIQDAESEMYLVAFAENKFPTSKISLANLREKLVGKLSWTLHTL